MHYHGTVPSSKAFPPPAGQACALVLTLLPPSNLHLQSQTVALDHILGLPGSADLLSAGSYVSVLVALKLSGLMLHRGAWLTQAHQLLGCCTG